MTRRKGKSTRGKKKTLVSDKEEELKSCPHSFVFHRGQVGKNVSSLVSDVRRVMEPFTATNLKVRKNNVLKDFVSIAGPLNVTHLVVLTKSDVATNMRIIRLPRGPTLTFKVNNYCLARDVMSSLKKRALDPKAFQQHPLLVMNNFTGEGMQIKLMATMFQNMFPSININKVKLKTIRRCVLLNYNAENKAIDFRHYNIRAVPTGVSRSVKKLIKSKVPNLGKYEDVSEFMTRGDVSESEGEMDGAHNEVVLPQSLPSRGNMTAQKSAIRLSEIGPRLTLQLVKIEEGVAEGNVLYHEFIQKTEVEKLEAAKLKEKKKKLKAERKRQQQQNIEAKKHKKQEHKERSLAGMKTTKNNNKPPAQGESDSESDVREDIEYFKQEVGEAPEPELFPRHKRKMKSAKKRKHPDDTKETDKGLSTKKVKFSVQKDDKQLNRDKQLGNKMKKKSDKFDSKQKFKGEKTHGKNTVDKKSEKKKALTVLDKMRRSKVRKEKRAHAKKIGKRANKPRRC